MKRILIVAVLSFLLLYAVSPVSAMKLTVVMPVVNNGAAQAEIDAMAPAVQSSLSRENYAKFDRLQEMPRGFANANAVISSAGTNQSFRNYDLFSVMVGYMYGSIDGGEKDNDFLDGKDPYIGRSFSAAASVGINASKAVKNLYIGSRFGYLKKSYNEDDYTLALVGFSVNYALMPDWSYLYGLARWRGIS